MNFTKKLTKIISAIIVIVMLLSGITATAQEREVLSSGIYGEVNWTLYSDGELRIDGEGIIGKIANNSTIPWSKWKTEITRMSIGKGAVYDSTSMLDQSYTTTVSGYPALTEITVDEGNSSLSADENGVLFNYDKTLLILFPIAKDLSEYTVPDTVTQLEDGSFRNSKIKKIIIGESVTKIGGAAFSKCENLNEVIIEGNKVAFDRSVFSGCSSLKSFVMPEENTAVSTNMFTNCENLESVVLHSKITIINHSAFSGCSRLSEISLPESVTSIGRYAFKNCASLKSINIPSQVTKIDFGVFSNCSDLKEIVIGEKVKNVENDSFNGCESIESVEIKSDISAYNLLNIIKNSKNLKKITISGNNQSLCCDENSILFSKDKTELLCYPSGKTDSAYVIPDTVKRINENAFRYAAALEDITIPQTVEYIGNNAFLDTGFYNDPANWDSGFLYIGTNLVAADSKKITDKCRLFTKTTLIASRVFEENSIASVYIPDNVKHINDYAFIRCTNLEAVNLPDNLKTLGIGAFYGCSKLKEIEIPSGVSELSNFTFYNATLLENIILNEGLKSIGEKAFYNTSAIKSLEIPSTVTAIDPTAFDSSGITDIYYGDTKSEWKRAVNGESFADITIHYTLKNDDGSVIIQHTDENFTWEAGNVHLNVSEITSASPTYNRNGYYIKNMINPVKVLDIRIVDGDGNTIQPLSDETITVKIKAPDEFISMISTMLNIEGELDFKTVEFFDGVFTFEQKGEKTTVAPSEAQLNKLKIIHWFSDGTEPGDYEVFTHSKIKILNGYIVLETNRFSEYAVCTEYVQKKDFTIKWFVDGVATEHTVTEEAAIIKPVNPEKEGYTFIGWTPEVPDTMPAENLEFTAVWQVNKYTITFDTAGGTAIAPITLEYGAAITSPANPEKEGFDFIRWAPELPDTMPANDITVVAEYKKAEKPEAPAPTITGIKIIALPNKTKYIYRDESFELNGLALKVMYSDGTSKIITDTNAFAAYGFNADSVGTKTITVAYGSYTDEFEITVSYAWWQWIIRILLLGFLWY